MLFFQGHPEVKCANTPCPKLKCSKPKIDPNACCPYCEGTLKILPFSDKSNFIPTSLVQTLDWSIVYHTVWKAHLCTHSVFW